jgi:hypothetical protein
LVYIQNNFDDETIKDIPHLKVGRGFVVYATEKWQKRISVLRQAVGLLSLNNTCDHQKTWYMY